MFFFFYKPSKTHPYNILKYTITKIISQNDLVPANSIPVIEHSHAYYFNNSSRKMCKNTQRVGG